MLDLLAQLVGAPSLSGAEAAAAGIVAEYAELHGFLPRRSGNNVIFELGHGAPRLLFNSHIDTVPPAEGWTGDPFRPGIEADRVIGLGANDAKGCVAAMLLAAARLRAEGLDSKGTLVVAITAEEETGGQGGISSVLPQLGQLDGAVFGEPTSLAPCLAQRGMLLLRCTAKGSGGHVAHAKALELKNAIHEAARDIARLEQLQFEPFTMTGGEPHMTQAQVTSISGGISPNQIPECCEFRVDLRTTPNLDHRAVFEMIAAELDSDVEVISQRYLPVCTDANSPVARAALAVTGQPAYFSGTACDWSLAPHLAAVKLGPGDSYRSHRPDEYLLLCELKAGVACYTQLARQFFQEYCHER
jgi:acetylornithine deacetylase